MLDRTGVNLNDFPGGNLSGQPGGKFTEFFHDEFGYVSCNKEAGELLFNHLSLRAGKKSIIITTNLAFNRWNEIIADKVLVTAMVDRLTHLAMMINMTGDSFRMKETKKLISQSV